MDTKIVDHPIKTTTNSYFQRGSGPRFVACSSIIRGTVIGLAEHGLLPFVIGAAKACDYVITGSTMAPYHVAVEMVDDQWVISAVDDKAQVWVNNEPVSVAVLDHGDQVQLGRHLLLFLSDCPEMFQKEAPKHKPRLSWQRKK